MPFVFGPGTISDWVTSDFSQEWDSPLTLEKSKWWDTFFSGSGNTLYAHTGDGTLDPDTLWLNVTSAFKQSAAIRTERFASVDQCVRFKVVSGTSGSPDFSAGAFFRVDPDGKGQWYRVALSLDNSGGAQVKFSYYTGTTFGGDIETSVSSYEVSDGHYIGFAVEGTGASTVAYFWDFGSSLPDTDAWDGVDGAGSNWGANTWKSSTDPSSNAVDTGNRLGIAAYCLSTGDLYLDDFGGGAIAEPVAGAGLALLRPRRNLYMSLYDQ